MGPQKHQSDDDDRQPTTVAVIRLEFSGKFSNFQTDTKFSTKCRHSSDQQSDRQTDKVRSSLHSAARSGERAGGQTGRKNLREIRRFLVTYNALKCSKIFLNWLTIMDMSCRKITANEKLSTCGRRWSFCIFWLLSQSSSVFFFFFLVLILFRRPGWVRGCSVEKGESMRVRVGRQVGLFHTHTHAPTLD